MQGLRKHFYSSAKAFAPVLLDKFKDKNAGVCRATTDALINMHKCVRLPGQLCLCLWNTMHDNERHDCQLSCEAARRCALFVWLPLFSVMLSPVDVSHLTFNRYCFSLSDVADDYAAVAAGKLPKPKIGALLVLRTAVSRTPAKDAAKAQAVLAPPLAKAAMEPAPEVREAALQVTYLPISPPSGIKLISDASGALAAQGEGCPQAREIGLQCTASLNQNIL